MDRRAFLLAAGISVSFHQSGMGASPPPRQFVIGYLTLSTAQGSAPGLIPLEDELRKLGYEVGRNLALEGRFADGRVSKLPELAAELVALRVDLIIAPSNAEIAAAKQATSTVPVVMVAANDPVGAGFVTSLARPGGNITGLSTVTGTAIRGKRLELLKQIVPTLSRVAVLREATSGSAELFTELDSAARKLGIVLDVVEVRSMDDLGRAFATIAEKRPQALYIDGGSLFYLYRQQIADFALANRLPATYGLKAYAEAGLLMTYGLNLFPSFRRAAIYADKLLKGASPADLPVEQPATFELIFNMKTAKALGITIPKSLLLLADELIK